MSGQNQVIVVEQTLHAERLDTFLRSRLADVSRGTIQRLLAEGHITVNGKPAKPTHHPHHGETIEIRWPEAKPAEAQPEEIPLHILHEDADLVVVNKPAGLVVHPAAGHDEHTLVNALLHHCEGQLSGIGGVARPGIVHRLDKDTSGCLVVAKNDKAHLALAEQFAGRSLEKIYHAILCGNLTPDKGEIDAAIARHEVHRKRMTANQKGRAARTSFRVLERLREVTLVEATIHTGRTHQIRVHFQHLGFPVVGDDVYGSKANKKLKESRGVTAPRQMLHAYQLTFVHPKSGRPKTFTAPWPDDFKNMFDLLKGK